MALIHSLTPNARFRSV